MKRFVCFMVRGLKSSIKTCDVTVIEGNNIEEITRKAKRYEVISDDQYSDYTAMFLKVLDAKEARIWMGNTGDGRIWEGFRQCYCTACIEVKVNGCWKGWAVKDEQQAYDFKESLQRLGYTTRVFFYHNEDCKPNPDITLEKIIDALN